MAYVPFLIYRHPLLGVACHLLISDMSSFELVMQSQLREPASIDSRKKHSVLNFCVISEMRCVFTKFICCALIGDLLKASSARSCATIQKRSVERKIRTNNSISVTRLAPINRLMFPPTSPNFKIAPINRTTSSACKVPIYLLIHFTRLPGWFLIKL